MAERRTPVSDAWQYGTARVIWECPDCGAVVANQQMHIVWHQLVAAAVDSLPEERR